MLCTDSARSETAPCARTVWHSAEDSLCTEMSSSPGCCMLPAPSWGSPRPQTLRDFYAVVCVPVTVVWTSRRPPSWSKTLMIIFSTGSSTSMATFCSHCFLTTKLCHALRDRRHDVLLSCRPNSLTDSNFIIRQLFKDSYWLWFYTCMYSVLY